MPVVLLTLPAVSPTGFSLRSLWALADFSDCSSKFTVRVSFLPQSDLCSSSEMTSLSHRCIFSISCHVMQKFGESSTLKNSVLISICMPVFSNFCTLFSFNNCYNRLVPHFIISGHVTKKGGQWQNFQSLPQPSSADQCFRKFFTIFSPNCVYKSNSKYRLASFRTFWSGWKSKRRIVRAPLIIPSMNLKLVGG